ncbi:MAG: hypothetical protein NTX53_20765 [candidate division WOR-3 bacterium]|nr:hypothetical protein [candidate division WOR-3 bacterium]
MKISKVVLRTRDIQHFTEDEKCLFATTMLALNEINILITCATATWPEVHPPRDTRDLARSALSLFFYQQLAGKLIETWNNLRRDRALAARRAALPDRARVAREHLAKYFGGSRGTIRLLRTKLVFHFDRDSILGTINSFSPDESFEIWMPSRHRGDVRYELGAKITAAFLNSEFRPKDGVSGFDQFVLETRQVWEWMYDLLTDVLGLLLHENLLSDVEDEDVPDRPDPVLPILGAVALHSRKQTE